MVVVVVVVVLLLLLLMMMMNVQHIFQFHAVLQNTITNH
jgi:hypothetical protein